MDPINGVDIEKDTTFALMLEAQQRGHRVYWCEPQDLGLEAGKVTASAQAVLLRREQGRHAQSEPATKLVLDDSVDVAFQRKDPPGR